MQPAYRVTVGGRDIGGVLADRLVSLTVSDSAGVTSDTVEIVLDDRDQRLEIPKKKTVITVAIGYDDKLVDKGEFVVEEVSCRGPDRTMHIRGNAPGASKGAWAAREKSWDKTTLGEIARKIAGERGWTPAIAKDFDSIRIDHVDQTEGDLQFLTRLAAKNGGVAKVAHARLVIAKHGESKTTSGKDLPPVVVDLTTNTGPSLCEWDWTTTDRGAYDGVSALYYDVNRAERGKVTDGQDSEKNTTKLPHTYSSKEAAARAAKAKRDQLNRGSSTLSILSMPGVPEIEAETRVDFKGLRAGVDGLWVVNNVIHELNDSGYTCRLECETPKTSG